MSLALGLVEFNSIAKGIESTDIMVKTAQVELITARAVCPGKYIGLVSGEVSAVESSVAAGIEKGQQFVVDTFILPNVHASLLEAFNNTSIIPESKPGALGIIETFSIASIILAADAAAKASDVEVIDLKVGIGIGGKGVAYFSGEISAVEAAVQVGTGIVAERGLLVQSVVVPIPDMAIWNSLG